MTLCAASASLDRLKQMSSRFAPLQLRADTSALSAGDRAALPKLIEAARLIDRIFLRQMWAGNEGLYQRLQGDKSPLGRARLDYFRLNKGPWSELDGNVSFLDGVPPQKLPGAGFYPEGMTKEEFGKWVQTLGPDARKQAEGFFTVIVRDKAGLRAVPYSEAYRDDLRKCAELLRAAAGLTENPSLRRFLETRAAAFLSNDYYESDLAWMDLDAPLDITIGPYETYNDELFGYKAAYEAYVNIRDDEGHGQAQVFRRPHAGNRKQPAHRPEIPQSETRRSFPHPRGQSGDGLGRWRSRCKNGGLQFAER